MPGKKKKSKKKPPKIETHHKSPIDEALYRPEEIPALVEAHKKAAVQGSMPPAEPLRQSKKGTTHAELTAAVPAAPASSEGKAAATTGKQAKKSKKRSKKKSKKTTSTSEEKQPVEALPEEQPAAADPAADPAAAPAAESPPRPHMPAASIVIGMAGTGKSTLMQRLNAYVHEHEIPSYVVNLDPAVTTVNYGANIDIRDTINYKEVMKQYRLGPNGGILTSLNLFATKFDQVLGFMENRAPSLEQIFIDTPGQIEVFTWSASGTIITESLAYVFPTVMLYIVDTPRNQNPTTFMSNMMYACSIMYKTKLPLIVVFNKIDVVSHEFAVEWMDDYDIFVEALKADNSFMSSLTRSMALALDEFYKSLKVVGVSAVTGEGIAELFAAIAQAKEEYYQDYAEILQQKKDEMEQEEKKRQAQEMAKVTKEYLEGKGQQPMSLGPRIGREGSDLKLDETDAFFDPVELSDDEYATGDDEALRRMEDKERDEYIRARMR